MATYLIYIYIYIHTYISNKTFGTINCALCMKERLEILKFSKNTPHLLINSSTEFYGACRHKPRFHRYLTTNCTKIHSTDDKETGSERVNTSDPENPQNSLGTIGTTVSHENNQLLCRPFTIVEPLQTRDSNTLAVARETSFVDV